MESLLSEESITACNGLLASTSHKWNLSEEGLWMTQVQWLGPICVPSLINSIHISIKFCSSPWITLFIRMTLVTWLKTFSFLKQIRLRKPTAHESNKVNGLGSKYYFINDFSFYFTPLLGLKHHSFLSVYYI